VFQSERFFREAWPQISHAFASTVDAATEVQWIAGIMGLEAGASVLDAPCGFGRHSIELGRLGYQVTGVDFSETELEPRRQGRPRGGREPHAGLPGHPRHGVPGRARSGREPVQLDRLLFRRRGSPGGGPFWRALKPGGMFVLDTRNRDQLVRSLPPEERRVNGWTLRIENSFDPATSRWKATAGSTVRRSRWTLRASSWWPGSSRIQGLPETERRIDVH
jgi:SAM-dependent methyltransferase